MDSNKATQGACRTDVTTARHPAQKGRVAYAEVLTSWPISSNLTERMDYEKQGGEMMGHQLLLRTASGTSARVTQNTMLACVCPKRYQQ